MPATDLETLRPFLLGVGDRAGHHAEHVKKIVVALAALLPLYRDADDAMEVRNYQENMAIALLVSIGGQRYCFSYDPDFPGTIDMRADSPHGPTLHRFTDATRLVEIRRILVSL